jgi:hypothetical protein
MIQTSDFPQHELVLAQLLCAKIALRLNGLVTVGLSSMQFDAANDYITGRNKMLVSLLTVLAGTATRPGALSGTEFRQVVTTLSSLFEKLFGDLILLMGWRNLTNENISELCRRIETSYSAFLELLQYLSSSLGVNTAYMKQENNISLVIEATKVSMSEWLNSSAGKGDSVLFNG